MDIKQNKTKVVTQCSKEDTGYGNHTETRTTVTETVQSTFENKFLS